jgi:hypothetical protein
VFSPLGVVKLDLTPQQDTVAGGLWLAARPRLPDRWPGRCQVVAPFRLAPTS